MNIGSIAGGIIKGRVKARGRVAIGFAAASVGYRVFRRLTRMSQRPSIRFAVKPGEIYEIRGVTRGR